jgi:ubiquinone biosynthesis O-methyltransferase
MQFVLNTLRSEELVPPGHFPLASLTAPRSSPGPARVLDVGCGGGVFLEAALRLGLPPPSLTAIEPAAALCETLAARLERCGLADSSDPERSIEVHNGPIESYPLPPPSSLFSVISLLEVIEHVPPSSRADFIRPLLSLLRPGGVLFVSTIDRTFVNGYLRAVFGAEHIARVTPVGTHDYDWFLRPVELLDLVEGAEGDGMELVEGCALLPKNGLLGEIETYVRSIPSGQVRTSSRSGTFFAPAAGGGEGASANEQQKGGFGGSPPDNQTPARFT